MGNFGHNLRKHRLARGLSITDLSKLSGVTRTTITNCEIGRRDTNIHSATKIVNALGISLDDLIGKKHIDPVQIIPKRIMSIVDRLRECSSFEINTVEIVLDVIERKRK